MTNTNIYLDVDGVLVDKSLNAPLYVNEFITYVCTNYSDSVYWLTTRCSGDSSTLLQQISHLYTPDVAEFLKTIKPTTWSGAKTNAIDFTKPFLWFDDNLFMAEQQQLEANDVMDNYVKIDLKSEPTQLGKLIHDFPIPTHQL